MSRFLYHTSCPKCGSRDNLAVYDDGHTFCFGCTNKTKGSRKFKIMDVDFTKKYLPEENLMCPEALDWLAKYNLVPKDFKIPNLYWNSFYRRLIFVLSLEPNVWQGRYLGDDSSKPKWFSSGKLHELHLAFQRGTETHGVIFTEDLLSAVKVSKALPEYRVVPLFGTHLSTEDLLRYKHITDSYYIWLDFDKRVHSLNLSRKFNQLGFKVQSVVTEQDPKEYSFDKIQECIYNNKIYNI